MPTDFDFSDLVFPTLGAAAALATPYHQGSSTGLISIINLLAHERNLREAREARGHEKELALEQRRQEQANKFFSGAPYFQDVTIETLLNQPEVQATQEEAFARAGEIPRPQLESAFPSLRRPTERAELDVSRPTTLPLPPGIATLHERIPLLEEARRAEQEAAKERRLPLKGGFYQGSAEKQIAEELGQAYDEREALGLRPGEQAVPQVTPGVPPLTNRIQPPLLPAIDQAVESFLESTRAIPAPRYKREVVTVDPLGRRYPPHVARALRAESIPTEHKLAFLTQIGALPLAPTRQEPRLEVTKAAMDAQLLVGQGYPLNHPAIQALQRIQIIASRPQLQGKELHDLAIQLGFDPAFLTEEQTRRLNEVEARRKQDARSLSLIDLYKLAATAPTPEEKKVYQGIINTYYNDQVGNIGLHFAENEKKEVVAIWTDKRTQKVLKQEAVPGTRSGAVGFRDILSQLMGDELARQQGSRGTTPLPAPPTRSRADLLEEEARKTQVPPIK